MAAKCSVFIATSLDGFISRPDGSMDWLEQANAVVPPSEDCGYQAFMSTVDGLVMGRCTFAQVLTFPQWPYGDKPVIVLSHQGLDIPDILADRVTHSSESPQALVRRLTAAGMQHIYIDGGRTIQDFLAAGLIDDVTLTVIPILLGAGRPLFGTLPHDLHLTLVASKPYTFGFVQHHYQIAQSQQ
jgi:dihydrofolate reductase